MKHAIMVMGSGYQSGVLQELINHFDDHEIDFFIHWDRKFPLPSLNSKYSKIIFIPRIKVYWGTCTQIYAEKELLKNVRAYKRKYDYVHLISSSDIPLMTKEYFKRFFKKSLYLGYVSNAEQDQWRLAYYYPINKLNLRQHRYIIGAIKSINKLLSVNRLKGKNVRIEKGFNWFSISSNYIDRVLDYSHMEIFNHTFLADETYLQTILADKKPKVIKKDDNTMAARYIDWKRGEP